MTGDEQVWEAGDGTRWMYFPQFGEWHGWMPGEDGLWVRTAEEFHDWYPEAPPWDARTKPARNDR
jgi:hypothetical protein